MKRTLWAIVLACAGLAGCSSARDTIIEKTIGPEGGTIAAGDGKMELTIPAGALDADTKIRITPLGGGGYKLEPSGLEFNEPATVTLTLPAEAPDEVTMDDDTVISLPNVVASRVFVLISEDGTEEILDGVAIARTAGENTVTATVPVPHFSELRRRDFKENNSTFLSLSAERPTYYEGESITPIVKFGSYGGIGGDFFLVGLI